MGDIAEVTKLAGFEFTEHVVYSDAGNIIALRGLNIKNGQLILDDVKYIDGSNFSKLNRSKLFIDDIMLTYVGTVGEVAIIKENNRFYLAPNVSRIRVQSNDSPKFISHYMRTDNFKNKVIFPLIATSSQPALSMENIRKFMINMPKNRDEQDCLAEYFDHLDHLITLHHRECVILQKTKVNDWEQRKLGEVFEFQYGEFNNNPDNGGEYPIYGANGIIGGYTDWNAENSSIIGHMGAYAGYVVWGEGKHFVTYNGTIARPKDNSIDSKYGYYLLDSKKIYKICAGSGQPFVSYSDLNGIDILLPKDKDEQRLLAYYFTNLDHLITLHQRM